MMLLFLSLGVIRNEPDFDENLLNEFADGAALLRDQSTWDKLQIVDLFFKLLPDFAHKETGKYMDQRM